MFAQQNYQEQTQSVTAIQQLETRKSIAFRNGETLPQGNWTLTISKGQAWVFCNNRNFIIKAGESVRLTDADGEVKIRAQFIKGAARYVAQQIQ